jgi:hypothetical protein
MIKIINIVALLLVPLFQAIGLFRENGSFGCCFRFRASMRRCSLIQPAAGVSMARGSPPRGST